MRDVRETNTARRARPRPTSDVARAQKRVPVRKYVPTEERRRQILEAAAELAPIEGFAGTTTREIAAIVGTTEIVLFRHFPTKESLYAAILEHRVPEAMVQRWLGDLSEIAAKKDDEALFAAVASAILESSASTVYHRLLMYVSLKATTSHASANRRTAGRS